MTPLQGDNCHYAPSITRGVVSVHRLVENGFVHSFMDFGISDSKNNVHYFNVIPSNGIYEIDMHDLVPNVNSIYNVSTKRAKHNLDLTYLWHFRLAHISKKRIEKLQQEGLLKSTDDDSFDQCVSCLSGNMIRKLFPHRPERGTNLLGIIHTDVCGPLRHVSRQESATRIFNMVPTKKVDKTPYELCEIPMEVEGFEPPQEEVILILESNNWIDAMNEEIQPMIGNMVWVLVDLPSGCKTVRSKWIFKKKTEMDGIVHTYKARLVAKDYTQLYGVDYKETFSPVADIRAIRILTSIAAYYDYEIWQMDVKNAFLNGYLDEDIYMVQPEGFVDPIHPRKNPGECHWTAVKNILKYLRNTKDMLLVYGGYPEAELRVDYYCDDGFKTDRDDTKSQTGYVFILNGGAVD
uniref:Retrotransposon protein, putative, Ty1-copia subclass n=1 Tax=Tanacetum cinerariifolium TaxID=118510 RepID=A0A699GGC5_TANCI|nr:retrotransposon protein, putative, Ty1-copia subclass [Tanacetum cinerariifolium]